MPNEMLGQANVKPQNMVEALSNARQRIENLEIRILDLERKMEQIVGIPLSPQLEQMPNGGRF